MNIVSGLVQPGKGENIVLTDLSYPSSVYPWIGYEKDGAEIRRISNHDGVIDVSDFEAAIDDRTKIVCLNRVEWTSGLRHDVKAICEIAHEHGALVLDDAFQAVGAVNVDVVRDGVDFLVFGGEKWLCSSGRAATLYVKPELVERYEPIYRFYWRASSGLMPRGISQSMTISRLGAVNWLRLLSGLTRDVWVRTPCVDSTLAYSTSIIWVSTRSLIVSLGLADTLSMGFLNSESR